MRAKQKPAPSIYLNTAMLQTTVPSSFSSVPFQAVAIHTSLINWRAKQNQNQESPTTQFYYGKILKELPKSCKKDILQLNTPNELLS